MTMPGTDTEEAESAPSEWQQGECVEPSVETAAMSLAEAVQAVRAERDMLLVRRRRRRPESARRGAC
jgi:hypothetical protein